MTVKQATEMSKLKQLLEKKDAKPFAPFRQTTVAVYDTCRSVVLFSTTLRRLEAIVGNTLNTKLLKLQLCPFFKSKKKTPTVIN